ncbi:glycosyltransferase family 2 protein [Neobacillus sp. Marseille-QA0830]
MSYPLVSIVIPTYNKLPLLQNTLHSLNHQSYPSSRYEIIVSDDCSTDLTVPYLKANSFNNLKIIASKVNTGPGPARNLGVEAAEGELVIFCDSDFILPYDFIQNHVNDHNLNPRLALSGMGNWHYVLTYDFGNHWYDYQKEDLKEAFANPFFSNRRLAGMDSPLLKIKDIYHNQIDSFLFCPNWYRPWVKMFGEIIQLYGPEMKDFQFPWISFCTGNVSILKDTFQNLGGFDESFRRKEDWEFGYRFFQDGGDFRFSEKAEAYQQLSPINPERNKTEDDTYIQLCRKYPHTSIYLLSLGLRKGFSYHQLSTVLSQHMDLLKDENKANFVKGFEKMLYYFSMGKYKKLNKFASLAKSKLSTPPDAIEDFPEWKYAFDVLLYS